MRQEVQSGEDVEWQPPQNRRPETTGSEVEKGTTCQSAVPLDAEKTRAVSALSPSLKMDQPFIN
jgi:hypothetical protein